MQLDGAADGVCKITVCTNVARTVVARGRTTT
jgi:hypothetical protein